MKKEMVGKIIFWIVIAIIIISLGALVYFGLNGKLTTNFADSGQYITYAQIYLNDDISYEFQMEKSTRWSGTWISIYDKDGVEYLTDTRNVLIIKEPYQNGRESDIEIEVQLEGDTK